MTILLESLFVWIANRDLRRAEKVIDRLLREERIRNRRLMNEFLREHHKQETQ